MADVKRCDRCGAIYNVAKCRFGKFHGEWKAESYDLCDDCVKELEEFLEGVRPKNLLERIRRMMCKEG